MLKSSIDLGTNTALLLVAEMTADGKTVARVRHDESTMVRLGEGLDAAKRIQPAPAARTIECLRRYAETCRRLGADPARTIAVGTASARDAGNGAEFFAQVERETGFRFRTLSGADEAKYSFRGGLLPGLAAEKAVVVDIGGGSTEFQGARDGVSLQMGSVRFTERYLKSDPVTDEEFWACQDAIDAELAKALAWRATVPADAELIGVAGTIVSLAQWLREEEAFDAAKIDGTVLTRGDAHRMAEELKYRRIAERATLPGIEAKRADVILAGTLVLWRAMERLDFAQCRVSTRGLRYGVLALD